MAAGPICSLFTLSDSKPGLALPYAPADVVTGPIRLLFPRIPGSIGEAADFPFSLLGALQQM